MPQRRLSVLAVYAWLNSVVLLYHNWSENS